MKQRSQGSGAKPIHRREVFNGTDTDTKAKSEPEKSALYLLEKADRADMGTAKTLTASAVRVFVVFIVI